MRDEIQQRVIDAVDASGPRLARTLQDLIRFESIVMSDQVRRDLANGCARNTSSAA